MSDVEDRAAVAGAAADGTSTAGMRLFRLGRSDEYSGHAAVLAVVLVLTPAVFLGCSVLAGGVLPIWLVAFTPLVLLLVPRAGSVGVLGLWLLLGLLWVASVPGPFSWWCLPAAACVLLAHVAASLLSGLPSTLVWPAGTRRRYGRRLGVVLTVTALVAGLARATLSIGLPGITALSAAALLGTTVWLWAGQLPDREAPTAPEG